MLPQCQPAVVCSSVPPGSAKCILNEIENSSQGDFYGVFKRVFKLESYLLNLSPYEREVVTKLRCCNLNLPIETGRWENIPRENRLCQLCNLQNIGNEYHYLFECTNVDFERLRLKFVPAYYRKNPNIHKMKGMIAISNINLLKRLSVFCESLLFISELLLNVLLCQVSVCTCRYYYIVFF